MPAEDLLLGVALQPLGALIPAADVALGVEEEDGVVLDAVDGEAEARLALAEVLGGLGAGRRAHVERQPRGRRGRAGVAIFGWGHGVEDSSLALPDNNPVSCATDLVLAPIDGHVGYRVARLTPRCHEAQPVPARGARRHPDLPPGPESAPAGVLGRSMGKQPAHSGVDEVYGARTPSAARRGEWFVGRQ